MAWTSHAPMMPASVATISHRPYLRSSVMAADPPIVYVADAAAPRRRRAGTGRSYGYFLGLSDGDRRRGTADAAGQRASRGEFADEGQEQEEGVARTAKGQVRVEQHEHHLRAHGRRHGGRRDPSRVGTLRIAPALLDHRGGEGDVAGDQRDPPAPQQPGIAALDPDVTFRFVRGGDARRRPHAQNPVVVGEQDGPEERPQVVHAIEPADRKTGGGMEAAEP